MTEQSLLGRYLLIPREPSSPLNARAAAAAGSRRADRRRKFGSIFLSQVPHVGT
jgi:hypothetical protein